MTPLATGGGVNAVALTVLIALFLVVTVAGFMASRFQRGDSLDTLDEWGLGGRKFGTWGNVFRFLPPLSISDELLDEAFGVVGEAFAGTA